MPPGPTSRFPGPAIGGLAVALVLALPLGAQETTSRSEAWRLEQPPQSSLVYARDGSLIGEIGTQWRTSVSIRTLPKYLPQAFIAVEDKRFYQHDGVDVVGIAGALKDAMLGDPRGASTITQLLVGNMHPDLIDRRDRTIGRKLREQQAAREMEKHYTKEQILEAFLNQLDFGHGWFGVESASRHYFGVSASRVTLAQAATLAALPKGPAIYDPIRHPDRARTRRNTVLALMAAQGYVTRADARAAAAEPVVTAPNGGLSVQAPWFVDVVRTQAERAGVPVRNGGYRVYTSLDPSLQRAATDALAEGAAAVETRADYRHVRYAEKRAGQRDYLQGMVVALDPASGEVRALVGGRDYQDSPFNRAVNGLRQPGSAFKPIVYAAAVADSITASTIVHDTAVAIPIRGSGVYRPENADRLFLGALTLREALARSRNVVAVELGQTVGMDTIAALARRLGVASPISRLPASAIGASAVHPLELVAAYAVFANLGTTIDPRFVLRVEDHVGRTVWSPHPTPPVLVLDPRVAFIVRDMMRDVVERGTATSVRRYLPERIPAAGKTGTTNDNTDVWFIGMTPELVAGVWLGLDAPASITAGAAGGSLAAPIWARMMARWYGGRAAGEWTPPGGLVIAELDRETGAPADTLTPPERRYTEYFIEGTEPASLRFDPWSIFAMPPEPY